MRVRIFSGVFMSKNLPKTIDEILGRIDEEKREITERFRFLVKSTLPKANELVRRGRITYRFSDKDFAAIGITKAHIDLLFFQGTRISSALLKGTGDKGDPRHVEIRNLTELHSNEPEITRLLKSAVTISTVV